MLKLKTLALVIASSLVVLGGCAGHHHHGHEENPHYIERPEPQKPQTYNYARRYHYDEHGKKVYEREFRH